MVYWDQWIFRTRYYQCMGPAEITGASWTARKTKFNLVIFLGHVWTSVLSAGKNKSVWVQKVHCVIRLVNFSFLQNGSLPNCIVLSILKICGDGSCTESAAVSCDTAMILALQRKRVCQDLVRNGDTAIKNEICEQVSFLGNSLNSWLIKNKTTVLFFFFFSGFRQD